MASLWSRPSVEMAASLSQRKEKPRQLHSFFNLFVPRKPVIGVPDAAHWPTSPLGEVALPAPRVFW